MEICKAVAPPYYYQALLNLAAPLYRLLVWKKSRHKASFQQELEQRFGYAYPSRPDAKLGIIWCHAVSLGEINTAKPLLDQLLAMGYGLWITSTTQTGFDRTNKLFAPQISLGKVAHSFVPVDKIAVITAFLEHVQPRVVLFIETELWANTLYQLRQRKIPAIMVNARLAQKSYQGYAKFAKLSASMMANLSLIIVQDQASAQRFGQLGVLAERLVVADSLKWSIPSLLNEHNKTLARQTSDQISQAGNRPVWVMASTHAGEEILALKAHEKLLALMPETLLILVPRHPERFDQVYQLCQDSQLRTARRGLHEKPSPSSQIFLADSLGELMAWYQVADVAVVGGSFVPVGGHNPIEPASLGKPILMGVHDINCRQLVQDLAGVGALVQLAADAEQLAHALQGLLQDQHRQQVAGRAAFELVKQKKQAASTQLAHILSVLEA